MINKTNRSSYLELCSICSACVAHSCVKRLGVCVTMHDSSSIPFTRTSRIYILWLFNNSNKNNNKKMSSLQWSKHLMWVVVAVQRASKIQLETSLSCLTLWSLPLWKDIVKKSTSYIIKQHAAFSSVGVNAPGGNLIINIVPVTILIAATRDTQKHTQGSRGKRVCVCVCELHISCNVGEYIPLSRWERAVVDLLQQLKDLRRLTVTLCWVCVCKREGVYFAFARVLGQFSPWGKLSLTPAQRLFKFARRS